MNVAFKKRHAVLPLDAPRRICGRIGMSLIGFGLVPKTGVDV